MTNYKYRDYMELKNLFRSCLEAGVEMSQEVKRLYWREIKRLQREAQSAKAGDMLCAENSSQDSVCQNMILLSLDWQMELGYMPEDLLNVEEHIEAKELSEAIHAAIGQLSEREQKIVALYLQGYTEREIADVIGSCQKSINNWKRAALSKLQKCLKEFR